MNKKNGYNKIKINDLLYTDKKRTNKKKKNRNKSIKRKSDKSQKTNKLFLIRTTITILSLLIISFLIFRIVNKNKFKIFNRYKNSSYYNFFNTTEINEYISICQEGILLKKPKKSFFDIFKKIKITVIIPTYNSEKYLKPTIRSIQNQNLQDFEILLIDDYSTDNTKKLINELMKEDKRIKMIENKKNMGTLYSRSIGALNAKGEYIMTIDHDDFFRKDIFRICYEEADNEDIDIIEFSACDKRMRNKLSNNRCDFIDPYLSNYKKDGLIIKQPELQNSVYIKKNNDFEIIDQYLWGKCIRTKLYKKAIKKVGKEIIFNQNICWCEDRIINFALFQLANSFKFIKVFGIIHNFHHESVGFSFLKNQARIFHDELFNVMSIYNITKNTENSVYAAYEFKRIWNFYSIKGLSDENRILAKNIFNKIINDKYIPEERKKNLIDITSNKLS